MNPFETRDSASDWVMKIFFLCLEQKKRETIITLLSRNDINNYGMHLNRWSNCQTQFGDILCRRGVALHLPDTSVASSARAKATSLPLSNTMQIHNLAESCN